VYITDNTVTGSTDGIIVHPFTHEVARNQVSGSSYGIHFQGISTTTIKENEIHDCLVGIGGPLYSPILDNTIHGCGTGIEIQNDLMEPVTGNTVVGCSGVGVYLCGNISMESGINRNLVVGNGTGFELVAGADSSMIRCNDAWGNDVANWIGISDPTGLNGNISADPLFCDEEIDDYRLHSCSPCAGGDCEGIGSQEVGCYCPESVEGAWEGRAQDLSLRCGPNPFAERCLVEFELDHRGRAELAVYELSGKRLCVVFEGVLEVGMHRLEWRALDASGRPLGSGAYYLRLEVEGNAATLPVVHVL